MHSFRYTMAGPLWTPYGTLSQPNRDKGSAHIQFWTISNDTKLSGGISSANTFGLILKHGLYSTQAFIVLTSVINGEEGELRKRVGAWLITKTFKGPKRLSQEMAKNEQWTCLFFLEFQLIWSAPKLTFWNKKPTWREAATNVDLSALQANGSKELREIW